MTLSDIKAMDKPLLTPREVAEVLGIDQQGLRTWAHQRPQELGFPVIITGEKGRSVRFPRVPFLNYITGGEYGD